MNTLDYAVLVVTLLGIAAYGMWHTRGRRDLQSYLHGSTQTQWFTIGISVMATQASAITFMSTPGQGYQDGLGFVQNYFGAPLALIVIAAVFVPIYRRLNVYTAYEFLGQRFDGKTRLLGTSLFLLQRGLAAGITIYAPAIVLSTVMGWRLDLTIVGTGVLVTGYTVAGGSDAVSLTQKWQMGVIFAGMVTAFIVLLTKLPADLTVGNALTVAGGFNKLEAVDYSLDPSRRYTIWSGVFGGMFLALSYFGTDQSQVQRYLAGASVRESRLGLMFNAIFKIPMQFFILLLGVFVFVFYQFERPPVFFNQAAWARAAQNDPDGKLRACETNFAAVHAEKQAMVRQWLAAERAGDTAAAESARAAARTAQGRLEKIRTEAKAALRAADPAAPANDSDYVFITFILQHLPHGLIGLLFTVFFAAALNSKAAELNALGSSTIIDLYRPLRPAATDAECVRATRWFTALWGLVAIGFALFAQLSENLIQASNILGSIFYGVMLGIFLVAFFLKKIGGTAVFAGALVAQALVFVLYNTLTISYLWYNVIGCVACVLCALVLQTVLGRPSSSADPLKA